MTNFKGTEDVNFEMRGHSVPILHFSSLESRENACYS